MYDWWVLQLAKLSVSRKLMVGFGVLLALLLLVVISSNRTLTHQTALSEQLAEVASLMEQTQQAEQGRLAFEAGSDPRQAEQVRQTLAGMLQRLQALRDSELDPAALAHQTEAIEAYRKAFDDLAAADQQRSAARGVLVGTAQQALDSFARLEELMDASLAQQAGDPQALQRSRAVADLHQQLLMVRYQVRGYVFERSDKAEQAAFAAFDALRQAATTLRGQLPGEADAALEQAMGSLQGYRGGIEQFRAGVIRTRQAQQAMQSSTQDMARAGRTLTEAGRQLRESTASRDRASLWLIAALALAFGCVAGWAINRQIVRPLDEALAQAEAIAAGDLGKRPQNPDPPAPRRTGPVAASHAAHGRQPARAGRADRRRRQPVGQLRRGTLGGHRADPRRGQQPESGDRPGRHRHARDGRHRAGRRAQRRTGFPGRSPGRRRGAPGRRGGRSGGDPHRAPG